MLSVFQGLKQMEAQPLNHCASVDSTLIFWFGEFLSKDGHLRTKNGIPLLLPGSMSNHDRHVWVLLRVCALPAMFDLLVASVSVNDWGCTANTFKYEMVDNLNNYCNWTNHSHSSKLW